jgi:CubicO group peptidase (beta-lactamase class C family)
MKLWKIFSLSVFLFSCGDDEPDKQLPELYFPSSTTWETLSPANAGWNEAKVPELLSFLEANNSRAFIVLKDGKIVLEEYWGTELVGTNSFTSTSNWYWASAGKTLTSAVIGIAESNNLIDFNQKTSFYLGTGRTNLTLTQENAITVRHQLTMTTGLDDGVANPDCTDPSCLTYKSAPGTRWAYHNAPYTLLDDVIANATGKTLNNYLTDVLKSKIGMDGQYIITGDNNVYYSTPRSMARFGLVLLNKGKWSDTQVIPEDYFQTMITTSQNLNLSYGYLTWLNGKTSSMVPKSQTVFPVSISPDAPADLFAAMGKNGQLINVVPSLNLVFIRMGDVPDNSLVPFTFQNDLWVKLNLVLGE